MARNEKTTSLPWVEGIEKMIDEKLEQKFGGSSGGSGLESRVARLEAAVEHIQRDMNDVKIDIRDIRNEAASHFRWTIGIGITLFLTLVGIVLTGFSMVLNVR